MLSTQEISTLRSPDMWRVNRMTPGLGLLAKHPDYADCPGFERKRLFWTVILNGGISLNRH